MPAPRGTPIPLPAKPSLEHLRKQAKRLAKSETIPLAAAQKRLAADHGFPSWKALRDRVAEIDIPPLHAAARAGDLAAVEARIAAGDDLDASDPLRRTALWHACDSTVPVEDRLPVVARLLAAGASPRVGVRFVPIHAAAARGPWAMVDLLIRNGALTWQNDDKGRQALDYARTGTAADKAEIVHKLDRPVIEDRAFRAAVTAIHAGDPRGLAAVLDAHPNLLHDRAIEPDCYPPSDYFGSPKLFWFVADNPNLVPRLPDNIVEVMQVMIDRGVDQADLDYALELIMTSGPANAQGLAPAMIHAVVDAGAVAKPRAVIATLAHAMTAPVEVLIDRGHPLTPPIAAGLGRLDDLRSMLPDASPADVQKAFAMAVFNSQRDAVRLCLEAGADVNGPMPVHAHASALHSAVGSDDVPMVRLLVERGARLDVQDRLWNSTPLGWAQHLGWSRSAAYLESLDPG